VLAICSIIALIINQFGSHILNVILATNKSRSQHILITLEYFLDQEKYSFFILLHINIIVSIGTITLIGTGSLYICYFQHTCGMFEIARYKNTYKNSYKNHTRRIVFNKSKNRSLYKTEKWDIS